MSGNLNLDTTVFYAELQSRLDGVSSETATVDLAKLFRTSELYEAADYTIFAAEVQSRINAVDEFTSDTEILKLAASLAKITNKNQDGINEILNSIYNQSLGGSFLAQDLNYISSKLVAANYYRISGIDASSGFAVALNLNGKFEISFLSARSLGGDLSVRLTVDGEIKWDSTGTPSSGVMPLLGSVSASSPQELYRCNNSLLLEFSSPSSPSAGLDYLVRPVL